jgi:hypothetical protein
MNSSGLFYMETVVVDNLGSSQLISQLIIKCKTFLMWFAIFLWLNPFLINAQILKDSASLNLVRKSIDATYNLRFTESGEALEKLRKAYNGHPVMYLLDGMQIYWKNYPLTSYSPASSAFENNLKKCIELCESKTVSSDEAEFLLANLSARGFLLMYYVDNDLTMSVIPLASSTYKYIRRSYDYTSFYSDFFFFTGLYDYTREAYPEAYPVYKPLAMLFPKGDKVKGMKELENAADNSIFLRAEASMFLSSINLAFEYSYERAYASSRTLHQMYPANLQYLGFHLRNLLLTKRYDEAEKLMESYSSTLTNAFCQAQFSIFRGVIQEKKYLNDNLAEQLYTKGIDDISSFGHIGNEFAAYGYFGLSRISGRKGETNLKKTYRKKADELSDFKNVNFD